MLIYLNVKRRFEIVNVMRKIEKFLKATFQITWSVIKIVREQKTMFGFEKKKFTYFLHDQNDETFKKNYTGQQQQKSVSY